MSEQETGKRIPSGRDSPGPGDETPLHYAASSDDVDVAEALIEGGANIETPDGSIGTPLDNAVGYGCWHVARLRQLALERSHHARYRSDRLCPVAAGGLRQIRQGVCGCLTA